MPALPAEDQIVLPNPPKDGITAVKFQPGDNPSYLAVTSWDTYLILYNLDDYSYHATYKYGIPVFDVCFDDASHVVVGDSKGSVTHYDIEMNNAELLGTCNRSVSCVHKNKTHNLILSGSWDKTVCTWDPRSPSPVAQSILNHANEVTTMDSHDNLFVVGTLNRHVCIWDLRNTGKPIEDRESTLKFQTRCIRCFSNGQGYALSSIEGRVALEPYPEVEVTFTNKYAFKCHRSKLENHEVVYPVTALAIHPVYNTFASGGGDGIVNIWDGVNRKRIALLPTFPTTISSLEYNDNGTKLAIASSYMYEEGQKADEPPPTITIRNMNACDVKPKTSSKA